MQYTNVVRSQKEIDDLLNACVEAEETGKSKCWRSTHEEGAKAAIEWLLDMDAEHPLED